MVWAGAFEVTVVVAVVLVVAVVVDVVVAVVVAVVTDVVVTVCAVAAFSFRPMATRVPGDWLPTTPYCPKNPAKGIVPATMNILEFPSESLAIVGPMRVGDPIVKVLKGLPVSALKNFTVPSVKALNTVPPVTTIWARWLLKVYCHDHFTSPVLRSLATILVPPSFPGTNIPPDETPRIRGFVVIAMSISAA